MKYINYILILLGAFVAMYAKAGADQNQALLVIGIVMLMLGVYRVSRKIPSKNREEDDVEDSENK